MKNKIQWIGSQYGGFYICEDDINKDSIIYSFGIGEEISFDLGLINKFNCNIFAFDPTPKSKLFMEKIKIKEIIYHEYGLSDINEYKKFHFPKNKDYVSCSVFNHNDVSDFNVIDVQLKDLKTIMRDLNHDKIDILKMDIEGSEYDVIDYIIDNDIQIEQIIFEKHDRFFVDGKDKDEKMFSKLNTKYKNIANTEHEFTFMKKEKMK